MELSFELPVQSTREKIWHYYADVQNWYAWEDDLLNISLQGDFITGGSGVMELEGQPPIHFELTSVQENESFWDRTVIPGVGSLLFGHDIVEKNGELYIKHTVSLQDAAATPEHIQFVFSDVPGSVYALKCVVEQ